MSNTVEYRDMPILANGNTDKRLQSDYYVEGFATTFNQPYLLFEDGGVKFYEVIDRHAIDGADMSSIIYCYNHGGKIMARTENGTLLVEPQNNGLFTAADLSMSADARNHYEEIKNRLITKMSWAFTVAEDSFNKDTHTRTILKIQKVYDVSAVSYPANNNTGLSARGYFANNKAQKTILKIMSEGIL